jgi:hypothetical protein
MAELPYDLAELFEPISAKTSLEFLQKVYRDPSQPLSIRLRASIACLPFEAPKLAVVAQIDGRAFAKDLEAAINRRRLGKPQEP